MPDKISIHPTVFLDPVQITSDLLRLDLKVAHLPENFVGLAFDLEIEGGNWRYEKHELGPIFQNPDNVLVLATQKDGVLQDETLQIPEHVISSRLVFGLSMKGSTLEQFPTVTDSRMVSLYFQTLDQEPLNFRFANQVFSIFDQERKDLKEVVWQEAIFPEPQLLAEEEDLSDISAESLLPQSIAPTDLAPLQAPAHDLKTSSADFFAANLISQNFPFFLLLGILFALAAVFLVKKLFKV